MTFTLPTYTGPYSSAGSGWAVVDYKPGLTLRSDPAAAGSGTMSVTFPQVDPGFLWSIQRAVVTSTSGAATRLRLYDSMVDPAFLLSGTDTGEYDEAEYPNGLLLDQGRQLVGVWTGASDGARGTVRLQVAVLGRVS